MNCRIEPQELDKLYRVLNNLNIDSDIIRYLCQVNSLCELNKVQYNYLLYILCLK